MKIWLGDEEHDVEKLLAKLLFDVELLAIK